MGKSYFDFGSLLKKKDKKEDTPELDAFGLTPMNIKKWSNTVTFSDRPRNQITATQQMMTSNYLMQQSYAAANEQAAKQAQMLQSQMTLAQLDAQTEMLKQMIQKQPLTSETAEYAPIQDCHCNGGCWDCDDRKVMAIPTIEWDMNL